MPRKNRAASARPKPSKLSLIAKPERHRAARPKVIIYTDGSCSPNPGRGGWAALLTFVRADTGEITELEMMGAEAKSTNNRMEIFAAIAALEALKVPCEVELFSDSRLVVNGGGKWINAWARREWRRKEGELLNADLWRRLYAVVNRHQVSWVWVRGHDGHASNERVDALARHARVSVETLADGGDGHVNLASRN